MTMNQKVNVPRQQSPVIKHQKLDQNVNTAMIIRNMDFAGLVVRINLSHCVSFWRKNVKRRYGAQQVK